MFPCITFVTMVILILSYKHHPIRCRHYFPLAMHWKGSLLLRVEHRSCLERTLHVLLLLSVWNVRYSTTCLWCICFHTGRCIRVLQACSGRGSYVQAAGILEQFLFVMLTRQNSRSYKFLVLCTLCFAVKTLASVKTGLTTLFCLWLHGTGNLHSQVR